jgi:hypothetical protein
MEDNSKEVETAVSALSIVVEAGTHPLTQSYCRNTIWPTRKTRTRTCVGAI